MMYFIDLFCGAGGVTTGIHMATGDNGEILAKVIACVNHDPLAIQSHLMNHPQTKHYTEDIKTLNLTELKKLVDDIRAKDPDAIIVIWASLECTNFSKAKGGLPRDADSRTLAMSLIDRSFLNVDGKVQPGEGGYLQELNPDMLWIENVEEFMSWGPLDEKGKPVSKHNGQDFIRWINDIIDLGYVNVDYKILNSADYGAYTSRKRLFMQFTKDLPIVWPTPTHSKKVENTTLFTSLQKWKPVKEVLDFSVEGNSIFIDLQKIKSREAALKYLSTGKKKKLGKKKRIEYKQIVVFPTSIKNPVFGMNPKLVIPSFQKENFDTLVNQFISIHGEVSYYRHDPYSEKTLERIEAGLIKHIAGGKQAYIVKYNSYSNASGAKHCVTSIDEPLPVITCQNRLGVVETSFLSKYYSGRPEGKNISVEGPAGTITTIDGQALVQPEFLMKYHGRGENVLSINGPCSTLTTKDRLALIQPDYFIEKKYKGDHNHQSIEEPAGTILTTDKHNLVICEKWIMNTNYSNVGSSVEDPAPVITANRKHHYLLNPQWGVNSGSDVNNPCPTIIARQDKSPMMLVITENGDMGIKVYETDSMTMRRIKQFMAVYGIVDIKMRMLLIKELLPIQGFPKSYKLAGNQTHQKKFIGNSVTPIIPKRMVETTSKAIINNLQKIAV